MQAVTQAANLGEVGDDSVGRRRHLLAPPFEHADCIPSLGSVRAPKGVERSFHVRIGVDTLLHNDLPAALQNLLGSPLDSDESNNFGDGGPCHSRELQWKTGRRQLTGSRRVRSWRYARRFSCWRSARWREVCQKGHHGRKQLWAGSLTLNHAVQLLAELCDHWSTGGWSSSTGGGDGHLDLGVTERAREDASASGTRAADAFGGGRLANSRVRVGRRRAGFRDFRGSGRRHAPPEAAP